MDIIVKFTITTEQNELVAYQLVSEISPLLSQIS